MAGLTMVGKVWPVLWGGCIGLGIVLAGGLPGGVAQATETMGAWSKPRAIEQPMSRKLVVTLTGMALIGAELWWFLRKRPPTPHQPSDQTIPDLKGQPNQIGSIQDLTITVDDGYQPTTVTVSAGLPVRLNFFRKDANHCLDDILIPDFGITAHLTLNATTTVEFTPEQTGSYRYTCGRKIFQGTISVQANTT